MYLADILVGKHLQEGITMTSVTGRAPKKGTEATVNVNLGTSMEEASALFGAEVVYNSFHSSAVIAVQNSIRRLLEADKTPEQIQTILADWKPGQRQTSVRKDPFVVLRERLAGMDPMEARALLNELKKSLG